MNIKDSYAQLKAEIKKDQTQPGKRALAEMAAREADPDETRPGKHALAEMAARKVDPDETRPGKRALTEKEKNDKVFNALVAQKTGKGK